MKLISFSFLVLFLFSSCASRYQYIRPLSKTYASVSDSGNGIHLQYQSEVMFQRGNKKQVRKEIKNDISVIAVRIENHSENHLQIGKNARFYCGETPVYIFQTAEAFHMLKQKWPYYLFYLGFTPMSGTLAVGGLYAAGPVGIILGPGLTLLNSLKASKANKRLLSELNQNSLIELEIAPGKVVGGLIVIDGDLDRPLYLKFNEN